MVEEMVKIIRPNDSRLNFGLKEVWEYRELLMFLTWKQIKTRYKQTTVGAGWAIIQPLFTMVIFTIIFGTLAQVSTEVNPQTNSYYSYQAYVIPTLILWTYFSTALTQGSLSLVSNANMISKVYFPRMLLPLSICFAGLLDYAIAAIILSGIMIYYSIPLTAGVMFVFIPLTLAFLLAAGLNFWLSAMAAKYRDIQYITPFFIQLLMFASPIIYSWNAVKDPLYHSILTLNPLSGIMVAQRGFIIGSAINDIWLLPIAAFMTFVIMFSGLIYFKKYEKGLADVI